MNNKTRKLKKNKKIKQKGGYIVPPTNPYFMAAAALIGGLYVIGQAQSSKTDAQPTAAPSQPQGQSGGRKFRRTRKKKAGGRKTRRINKRKKGTRRRKQKGGDRELGDMVVDLTLMFLPSRISMSNFNDKQELKMAIIEKVKTINDMGELEEGLKRILELFLDEDENCNYQIDDYDPELKDPLKEILKEICNREEVTCNNNRHINRILE